MPLRGFNPLSNAIENARRKSMETTQAVRSGRLRIPPEMTANAKANQYNQRILQGYYEKRNAINNQNQG
jgi:hypothetical protein